MEELYWVLRWVGAWMIVLAVQAAAWQARLLYMYGLSGMRSFDVITSVIGNGLFVALGVGVFHRYRWAMQVAIALLWAGMAVNLFTGLAMGAEAPWGAQRLLTAFVELLLLAALLERADERETLQRPRHWAVVTPAGSNHLRFFTLLLAWYWTMYLLQAGLQLAGWAVVSHGRFPISTVGVWYGVVRGLLLGICGLALFWQWREALLGIIAILLLGAVATPWLNVRLSGRPLNFLSLASSLPLTMAMSWLLFVAYRRLGQAKGGGSPIQVEVPRG